MGLISFVECFVADVQLPYRRLGRHYFQCSRGVKKNTEYKLYLCCNLRVECKKLLVSSSAKCPGKCNRLWLIAEFVIERAAGNGGGTPLKLMKRKFYLANRSQPKKGISTIANDCQVILWTRWNACKAPNWVSLFRIDHKSITSTETSAKHIYPWVALKPSWSSCWYCQVTSRSSSRSRKSPLICSWLKDNFLVQA